MNGTKSLIVPANDLIRRRSGAVGCLRGTGWGIRHRLSL